MQSSDRYDQRIAFYIWANCYYLFYCSSLSVANGLRPYKHSLGALRTLHVATLQYR